MYNELYPAAGSRPYVTWQFVTAVISVPHLRKEFKEVPFLFKRLKSDKTVTYLICVTARNGNLELLPAYFRNESLIYYTKG
jgi:hypothetical protein